MGDGNPWHTMHSQGSLEAKPPQIGLRVKKKEWLKTVHFSLVISISTVIVGSSNAIRKAHIEMSRVW